MKYQNNLLIAICFLVITACSDGIQKKSHPEDIIQTILAYQLNDSTGTSSGECTGTSGIRFNGEKFEIDIDVEGENGFNFQLSQEVKSKGDSKERLGEEIYEGNKFTCSKDGINYTFSVLMSQKTKMVFHIIDYQSNSIILRAGKKIED